MGVFILIINIIVIAILIFERIKLRLSRNSSKNNNYYNRGKYNPNIFIHDNIVSVEDELHKIDCMNGYEFEEWSARFLFQCGFYDIRITSKSNDQGVDIICKKDNVKYAVQCKCYSTDLGNTPIQEVYTGKVIYNCDIGAVITNHYFTKNAKLAAKATGVLLWDRDYITFQLKNLQTKHPVN